MIRLKFLCLLAMFLECRLTFSCDEMSIPYSFEVTLHGAPMLKCAQPQCFGWSLTSNFGYNNQTSYLKYLSAYSKIYGKTEAFIAQKANCSLYFDRFTCNKFHEWVGGISINQDSYNRPKLQCCFHPITEFSENIGIFKLKSGHMLTGGEVFSDSRLYAFDYISNIVKIYSHDEDIAYQVYVRRIPCIPYPKEFSVQMNDPMADFYLIQNLERNAANKSNHAPEKLWNFSVDEKLKAFDKKSKILDGETKIRKYENSSKNEEFLNVMSALIDENLQKEIDYMDREKEIEEVDFGIPKPDETPQEKLARLAQEEAMEEEKTRLFDVQNVDSNVDAETQVPPPIASHEIVEDQTLSPEVLLKSIENVDYNTLKEDPKPKAYQSPTYQPACPNTFSSMLGASMNNFGQYPYQQQYQQVQYQAVQPQAQYQVVQYQQPYYYGPECYHAYFCFSGDTMVETIDGKMKRMDELKLSDWVMTSNGSSVFYAQVESWIHRMPDEVQNFLHFMLDDGTKLKITSKHYIYKTECSSSKNIGNFDEISNDPVYASDVRLGDCLYVLGQNSLHFRRQKVIQIHTIQEKGIYSPLTTNGNIIVNGIYASCYNVKKNDELYYSFFKSIDDVSSNLLFDLGDRIKEVDLPVGMTWIVDLLEQIVPMKMIR